MSDAVRRVVIEMSIEQREAALKAPDIAPVIEAEKKITEAVQREARLQQAAREGAQSSVNFGRIATKEILAEGLRLHGIEEAQRGGELIGKQRAEMARMFQAQAEQQKIAKELAAEQAKHLQEAGEAALGAAGSIAKMAQALLLMQGPGKEMSAWVEKLLVVSGGLQGLQAGKELVGGLGGQLKKIGVPGNVIKGGGWITAILAATYGVGKFIASVHEENEQHKREAKFGPDVADQGDAELKALLRKEEQRKEAVLQRARAGIDFREKRGRLQDEAREDMTPAEREADRAREQRDLEKGLRTANMMPGQDEKASLEQIQSIQGRLVELEKQRTSELEKQTARLQANVDQQREAVEQAKRLLAEEKKRVESIEERMGSMSELEQAEAEALARKIKAGGATREDLLRAKQLGLGDVQGDEIGEQLRGLGKSHRERLEEITGKKLRGPGSKLDDAQAGLEGAEQGFNDLMDVLKEAQDKEAEHAEKLKEAIQKWIDARIKAVEQAWKAERGALQGR